MEQIGTIPSLMSASPTVKRTWTTRQRAIRGAVWTSIGFGGSQFLRFAGNLILTRLLVPQFFGLMTLVNIFIQGLQMFSDVGIRGSILRHTKKQIDPAFLDTAWTFQAVRGCVLWLLAAVLAWPFARIYHEPQLVLLIPICALTVVISGFNSIALFVQDRKLQLGKTTLLQLSSRFASMIVMIAWAYYSRSVWPLVAGSLVYSIGIMIGSYRLIPHRHRFAWDSAAGKEIFDYAIMIFFSTMALFLANTSERFILGKYITLAMLGIYSVGQGLSTLFTQIVEQLFNKVLYPTYAELLRERPKQAFHRYSQSRWVMAAIGIAVAVVGGLFGPKVIHALYDRRYWEAGWMLQIFAVESFCEISQMPAGYLLKAASKPGYTVIANGCRAGVQVLTLLIALNFFGLRSGIWMIAASAGLSSIVLAFCVGIAYPKLWRQELLLALTICATVGVAMWSLG